MILSGARHSPNARRIRNGALVGLELEGGIVPSPQGLSAYRQGAGGGKLPQQ